MTNHKKNTIMHQINLEVKTSGTWMKEHLLDSFVKN